MKTALLIACIVSLLIPSFSAAEPPGLPSLLTMLTEKNIGKQELQSIMSDLLSEKASMQDPADMITPQANYWTYVCYYFALNAVIDFVDCLVYYDFDYNCRSAIINALVFYYLC